jgi:hypothetical protein
VNFLSSHPSYVNALVRESSFPIEHIGRTVSGIMICLWCFDGQIPVLAKDFRAWQHRMGWTNSEAARQLGIQRSTLLVYRATGAPLHIGLAANALANSLGPWQRPK